MVNYLKDYRIKGSTLKDMASAIRRKYNFTDALNPEKFPLYISGDSNEFWLTHFATSPVGSGSVYSNTDSFTMAPGEFTALFKKAQDIPNGYNLQNIWNSYKVESTFNRYLTTDVSLLSSGCSYTTTAPDYTGNQNVNGILDDDGVRLTNGIKPPSGALHAISNAYSAWTNTHVSSPIDITVDLGTKRSISKAVLHGAFNFWGIAAPVKVEVLVSDDSRFSQPSKVYKLGESTTYEVVKNSDGSDLIGSAGDQSAQCKFFTTTVERDDIIRGRYVKFLVYSFFLWANEVEVYGITNNKTYYGYRQQISNLDSIKGLAVGDIALYGASAIDWLNQYTMLEAEAPEEAAKYTSWIVRRIGDRSSKYYSVVCKYPGVSSNQIKSSDLAIVYKGSTSGVNVDPIIDASEKYFYIVFEAGGSGFVELLSYNKLNFEHNISISTDEFIYKVKRDGARADLMVSRARYWDINSTYILENVDLHNETIPTTTPALNYLDDKYSCSSTYSTVSNSGIILDGNLVDTGWCSGGWFDVSGRNGIYKLASTKGYELNYKYKIKTDDTHLYFALISPTPVHLSSGERTTRLWLKTNDDATVFTHTYGINYSNSNGFTVLAKYNDSLNTNDSYEISDSSIVINWTNEDVFTLEFKVELNEFNGNREFEYFVQFEDTLDGEAVSLLFPKYDTVPYDVWDTDSAMHVTPASEQLTSDEVIAMIEEVL